MKHINKQAKAVMDKLTEGMRGIESHRKFNAGNQDENFKAGTGTFMAVCVEWIDNVKEGRLISLAHYFKQNGDMMRDPEIVFLHNKADKQYYPISIQQDSLAIYIEVIDPDTGQIAKGIQADITAFANAWMKNINSQQML